MYGDLRNTIYNAVKPTTGLNERLYYSLAPQNPGLTPYCVFYFLNQLTERMDSNSTTELFWIQFNVFSDEKTTIKTFETVSEGIVTRMDGLKNTISISGYKVLDFKKDFVLPAQKIEGFWRLSIQYSILLDKIK